MSGDGHGRVDVQALREERASAQVWQEFDCAAADQRSAPSIGDHHRHSLEPRHVAAGLARLAVRVHVALEMNGTRKDRNDR